MVEIGVGLGFPSQVSSPQLGVYEVGLGSDVAVSSPDSEVICPVGFFIYFRIKT